MEIKLKYRPEKMTLNDMCVLEQPPSHSKVRELLAKHFVNGNGEYIEDVKAAELAIGEIPKDDIRLLLNDLWKQINEYSQENDPN